MAERFNRTLQEGWAFKNAYDSSGHRTQALKGWLDFYNHRRNHSALGGDHPSADVTNLLAEYT